MGDEFTLEDALIIIQRRLLFFLVPVIALIPLGLTVVMLLPAQYTAQGTILVESAQIPSDLVRSTVNVYAQERIQTIRQRVMTRNRLLEIDKKYSIFPRELGLTESERVARMRERMQISSIRAEGRRASQNDGTIAFTVSYTDPSPDKAFRVANEFMSLFLTEDVRTRTAGAANTTEFFKQELRRLSASIDTTEQRIAEYKAEHADALPEHLDMHRGMLERASRDLAANDAAIAALDQETRFLEAQLASHFTGAEGGPGAQLSSLKSELVRLRAIYHDTHPSIQGISEQIGAIEASLRPSAQIQSLQTALARAENDMREAERTLPPGDPGIAEKSEAVTELQNRLSDRIAEEARSGRGDIVTTQLQGRISIANSRRSQLENRNRELLATIANLQSRIERTPQTERGLQGLMRNNVNLSQEYQSLLARQQEAQLAENLEDNQKAEKFSILEAAQRPETPSSPERAKLAVLVIFAAFAAGGGVALGVEMLSATLRGSAHLTGVVEAHPIAVIPNFKRGSAPPKAKRRLFAGRAAAPATAAVAAAMAAALPGDLPPQTQENVNIPGA